MSVLIVENDPSLGGLWQRHIERQGQECELAGSQPDAIAQLQERAHSVVILNLELKGGSPMAVADYVGYRYPETKLILVTSNGFFSDGSIFNIITNACAIVGSKTSPDDLAALAYYHEGQHLSPAVESAPV